MGRVGEGEHRSGTRDVLYAEGVHSGGPSSRKPGVGSRGSAEAGGPWYLLGPLANVVQAEGGHMVLGAHKQAPTLLIQLGGEDLHIRLAETRTGENSRVQQKTVENSAAEDSIV